MTDRELMQQALDALKIAEVDGNCCYEATELLRTRLAHCDRCGKLAAWMITQGYATGHGDTMEQLLEELGGQAIIRMVRVAEERVKAEREACAKVCEDSQAPSDWNLVAVLWKECKNKLAAAIRARGQA